MESIIAEIQVHRVLTAQCCTCEQTPLKYEKYNGSGTTKRSKTQQGLIEPTAGFFKLVSDFFKIQQHNSHYLLFYGSYVTKTNTSKDKFIDVQVQSSDGNNESHWDAVRTAQDSPYGQTSSINALYNVLDCHYDLLECFAVSDYDYIKRGHPDCLATGC